MSDLVVASQGVSPEWHERCRKRMARIDSLPPAIRALMNEFGSTAVDTCLAVGVTKPKHIRHLIMMLSDPVRYGNAEGGLIKAHCYETGKMVGAHKNAALRKAWIEVFLSEAER